MAKQLIREVAPHRILYRDDKNGIAWIEDGSTGCGISIHPNIMVSGSVRSMKAQGFWGKKDRTVRSHGFIYNIDHVTIEWDKDNPMQELEEIVKSECRCQACIERRESK